MTKYVERMKAEIQETVDELRTVVESKKEVPAQFMSDFENFVNRWDKNLLVGVK